MIAICGLLLDGAVLPCVTGGGVFRTPLPGFAFVLGWVKWLVSNCPISTAGVVRSAPESGLPWPGTVRPDLPVEFTNGWLEVVRPPAPIAVNRWSAPYPPELDASTHAPAAKIVASLFIDCSFSILFQALDFDDRRAPSLISAKRQE